MARLTSQPTRHVDFPFEPEAPAEEKRSTRDALIAAAATAFGESGYDGASIRDVERLAGVNRGLVAHYFGNKVRLWEAAVEETMRGMGAEMARFADLVDVVSETERVRIFLKVYVRNLRRHPEMFRMVIMEGTKDTARSRELVDRYMGALERFWQQATGVDEGLPNEVHAIRHFILLGAAGAIFAAPEYCKAMFGVDPHDPDFADRFADVIAEMWVRMRDFVEE